MRYNWLSQFHYGSIKTYLLTNKMKGFVWSQFHYGSIKTLAKCKIANSNKLGLNSTMVRLKQKGFV